MFKSAFHQELLARLDYLLHLLFNFRMDSENPFVLIICGLPQLSLKLSLSHHQPLSQRVIMRYRMQPLSREECKEYKEYQMRLAGARFPIFTDSAMKAITTVSKGWPRLINSLAITSLYISDLHPAGPDGDHTTSQGQETEPYPLGIDAGACPELVADYDGIYNWPRFNA